MDKRATGGTLAETAIKPVEMTKVLFRSALLLWTILIIMNDTIIASDTDLTLFVFLYVVKGLLAWKQRVAHTGLYVPL